VWSGWDGPRCTDTVHALGETVLGCHGVSVQVGC
jgi:hypothetical protein